MVYIAAYCRMINSFILLLAVSHADFQCGEPSKAPFSSISQDTFRPTKQSLLTGAPFHRNSQVTLFRLACDRNVGEVGGGICEYGK